MNQNFNANKLSVAKPCSESWENMTGDEQVRSCNSCDMNIYNISEMTSNEIISLIETREGRLCGRIVKRNDGTVMTKDCPPGIHAYRKKVSRFAGAAFATIISLCSFGYGQSVDKEETKKDIKTNITRIKQEKQISIKGVVTDIYGAVIPGSTVIVRKNDKKSKSFEIQMQSSDKGEYEFKNLLPDKYKIEIQAAGFETYIQKKLVIRKDETIKLNVVLNVGEDSVIVGIFVDELPTKTIDMGETKIDPIMKEDN